MIMGRPATSATPNSAKNSCTKDNLDLKSTNKSRRRGFFNSKKNTRNEGKTTLDVCRAKVQVSFSFF